MEESYGTDANNASDYPTDTDGDGIPDDDSPDGKYTGDTDDDNDGLDDETEAELGSDPKDGTDVTTVKIGENTYYFIDTDDEDTEIDTIYNPQTGESAKVTIKDGKILFDTTGDGKPDHAYDASSGEIAEYEEKKEKHEPFPVWLALLAIIIAVIIVIIALFKTGYLYFDEQKPGKRK